MPADDADEFAWLLYRQHQVIARRQVVGFMSDKAVRARLKSGLWQVATRGVYLAHNGPVTREQQWWIAALAAGMGRTALLAGISALEIHGLRGHTIDAIHVLIPARSQDRDAPAGVLAHRTSQLPRTDIHQVGQPPRTKPARSLVDAAQWASSDERARVIVAATFQQGLVGLDEVAEVLDRMPRAHRRALTREAAADAVGGSHSLPEAAFLRLCRRGGLPLPTRQVKRRDARGRLRYLDAYFEEWDSMSRSTVATT